MKKHNGVHTVRHKMEALHLSPACQYWLIISHLVLCGHMISCSPLNTSLGTNPKHWNITHHLFRYEATFLRARSCCRERGWLLKALTRFPSAQYWSGSLSFMYSSLRCPCRERQPRSWETLLTKHLAQGDTKKKKVCGKAGTEFRFSWWSQGLESTIPWTTFPYITLGFVCMIY